MKTYPYKAWILQPSFKPVEVVFEKKYECFGGYEYGDLTIAGKLVHRGDIFESKDSAIAEGFLRLEKQQSDLDQRQAKIEKKRATLNKAQSCAL